MNKNEYIAELRERLKKLPQAEAENAISYYEEYFYEAGAQNEQRVIQELGHPSYVAAKIIGDYVSKDTAYDGSKPKKGFSKIGLLIAGIFAAPIALPLAIAAASVVFALFITLFVLFVTFGALAIGFIVGGIVMVGVSFTIIFTEFATALFFIGTGLLLFSLGFLFSILVSKFYTHGIKAIIRLFSKLLTRRSAA